MIYLFKYFRYFCHSYVKLPEGVELVKVEANKRHLRQLEGLNRNEFEIHFWFQRNMFQTHFFRGSIC
jgi:hypothetical protein